MTKLQFDSLYIPTRVQSSLNNPSGERYSAYQYETSDKTDKKNDITESLEV